MPFDPLSGTRLRPAWLRLLEILNDGEWHLWADLVEEMTAASDIRSKTASNLIHNGCANYLFQRRGKYQKTGDPAADTRAVRLATPGRAMAADQDGPGHGQ